MAERTQNGRGPEPATPAVCPVALCPICMVVTATGQVRPDVVEHLMKAGREMLLAITSVLDARADAATGPTRLEKIEVE